MVAARCPERRGLGGPGARLPWGETGQAEPVLRRLASVQHTALPRRGLQP